MSIKLGNKEVGLMKWWGQIQVRGNGGGEEVETACRGHFSKKFDSVESSLKTLCFPTYYERTKL